MVVCSAFSVSSVFFFFYSSMASGSEGGDSVVCGLEGNVGSYFNGWRFDFWEGRF
jgi:hypothetical protein